MRLRQYGPCRSPRPAQESLSSSRVKSSLNCPAAGARIWKRLLKKLEKADPSGLKPTRDDKNKESFV